MVYKLDITRCILGRVLQFNDVLLCMVPKWIHNCTHRKGLSQLLLGSENEIEVRTKGLLRI